MARPPLGPSRAQARITPTAATRCAPSRPLGTGTPRRSCKSLNGPTPAHNAGQPRGVYFSATAVELVRGVLITAQVFLRERLTDADLWRIYRAAYGAEPFMRIVKERFGVYRYPEPKIVTGSNYCDIGFEAEPGTRRVVVMAALDNLMKGAAGNAVQALNAAMGWDETTGLTFTGLHPI